jgi:PPE-repeat protein
MLAAAMAWGELAFELHVAAASYRSVISELGGAWSGPSSASMAAAAIPHATWLQTTAAQAEETAARAKAAVAAYEAAFAATVPPPVIAANRSLLAALVATNFFGQNTPAIAVTEAQYAEMWAQDAVAMYGYAGSSASATSLSPFTPPKHNTDPGGSAGQAAAVGNAAGTSAGNVQNTVSSVPQTFSGVPNTLQSLSTAAPGPAADPPSPVTVLKIINDALTIFPIAVANLSTLFNETPFIILSVPNLFPTVIIDTATSLHTDPIVSGWAGIQTWPWQGTSSATGFKAIITNPGSLAASGVSAGLGQASTVGTMSVPSAWTIAAPAIRSAALTLPAPPETTVGAAAGEALRVGSGSTLAEMALGGMTGASMGGVAGNGAGRDGGQAAARTCAAGRAGTTANRPAGDGEGNASPDKPRIVVTGVAARIREIAKLRDEGTLSDQEYTEQKNRLLGL